LMPVSIVPPVMVQVGDLLYGPDAKGLDWPTPRQVIGKPVPCTVVDFRRRWPAIWRLREVRVVGYMVELHSDVSECGDIETLHAATVRVQR
jgi:hypothetical protein